MAHYELCGAEMTERSRCVGDKRIVYGDTQGHRAIRFGDEDGPWGSAETCPDCAVEQGEFHHPECDVKRCPRCGDQLLTCGCPRPIADISIGS